MTTLKRRAKRKSRARGVLDVAALVQELTRDEGIRLAVYQDSLGYWTIGIGRCVDARVGGRITLDEAQVLLMNDITGTIAALNQALPWFPRLDPMRQRVLCNMGFNLGIAGLLKFTNTLDAVKRGDYDAAAEGMLASKWAQQTGARAIRLAYMMRTGTVPSDRELKA